MNYDLFFTLWIILSCLIFAACCYFMRKVEVVKKSKTLKVVAIILFITTIVDIPIFLIFGWIGFMLSTGLITKILLFAFYIITIRLVLFFVDWLVR